MCAMHTLAPFLCIDMVSDFDFLGIKQAQLLRMAPLVLFFKIHSVAMS